MSGICDFLIVGENTKFCGTELVYKFLCPKEKYGDRLASFTHISDFALEAKSKRDNLLIKKISMSVKYLNDGRIANPRLREFVNCLANGEIDCDVINDAYSEYLRKSRPYLRKMLKSTEVIKVKNVRIAVSFGRKLSSQEACMELMKRLKTNISIFINEESGDGSIRSARDHASWGVESVGISAAFGGGGHPFASGFTIRKKDRDLSLEENREKITKKISEVAQRLYGKRIRYYQQNTGRFSTR